MPHEKALHRNVSNEYQMIACLYIYTNIYVDRNFEFTCKNIFEIFVRFRSKAEKKTECGKR